MQLFGMGADQVLALEVVTAAGEFLTATPNLNSDLYWAIL
jgi:FAD/FMN-containing dehydrogenase